MKAPENKEEKKGGLLAFFSRLFSGSSSSVGSASSMGAASSGLSGLLASKAGIVGMVLGGATIAAGVGVIYNFVGPSSKAVYSPGLFENQYYETQAEKAAVERIARASGQKDISSASLDYFKGEARKDGLFGAGEYDEAASEDTLASASAEGEVDVADYAPGAGGYSGAGAGPGNIPKLQKSAGFSSGSGGAKTAIPRMKGMGGLSGGIGFKFQNVYRPPAGAGNSSGMKGALASKINKSAKYKIPHYNKGGAYGQAKYAGKMSKAASYADGAGAKTTAVEAFEGQTAGEGDVTSPTGGAGLGGAGVSEGDKLKASDPNLNINNSEPPEPPEPEDVSPWEKYTDMALYGMLASIALIFITRILSQSKNPLMLKIAVVTAYAAIAAAAVVIFAGLMLMNKYGQKWMGIMYMMMGAALIWQAYQALAGVGKAMSAEGMKAKFAGTFWSKITPGGPSAGGPSAPITIAIEC